MFKKLGKWLISATVISAICIIPAACGGIASPKQAIQQLPRIGLPSMQVRALYSGADVWTVLSSIVPPLTDSIFHDVQNMDHMSYTASSNGSLIINVYFKPGTNMDLAGVNISNLVSIAARRLPSPVVKAGITVDRHYEPLVMAVDIYSEDAAHYDQSFLADYAATRIIPEIRQIPGVSHLITFDRSKDSLVRIWLNKGHMTTSNLTLKEVLAAVPAKELEAVTGINKNSKQPFDYIIKCKSEHNQLGEYRNKIIRTNTNTVVKLKDVAAKIEYGPFTYGKFTRINGKPGINVVVMQVADSNYKGIQIAVKKLMETASIKFPAGIKHSILYNPKDSLYISVE